MISTFSQAKVEFLDLDKYPKPMRMPRKYSFITNEMDIMPSEDLSQELWIVFSDRTGNYTTKTTNLNSSTVAELDFLEAFFIAAEQGQSVLLAKGKLKRGEFTEGTKNYGWINKRNLILSKHTLKYKNHIYRKGLVINSINHIKEVLARQNLNQLAYRTGPSLEYPEKDTSRVFNIYFIMKTNRTENKDATMYLLARRSLLYADVNLDNVEKKNRDIILGWLPANSLTLWNHRIAVEQNWKLEAVEQRKKHNMPAYIFLDKHKLRNYREEQFKLNADNLTLLDKDRFYETELSLYGEQIGKKRRLLESKRLDGYNMRYPIIEDYGKDIFSVGFIGDVFISKLKKLSSIQEAKGQKVIDQISHEFRKTNIVFVLDATNSMTPYLEAVSQAIKEAMISLAENENMRFGGVIYRDGDDPIPDPVKVTNDFGKVANYFKEEKGFSRQRPFAESMYKGIEDGMEKAGFKAGQHNCLVLISDVGNHRSKQREKEERLAELINKYNCNFLAIQVGRRERMPSEKTANLDFYLQNSRMIYNAIKKSAQRLGDDNINLEKPGSVEKSYSVYSAKGPLFLGKVLPLSEGEKLKKRKLKNDILTFINSVEHNTQVVLKNLDNIAQGKGLDLQSSAETGSGTDFRRNDLAQLTLNMMKMANLDLNIVNKIKEKRFQLYVNGIIQNRFELQEGQKSSPLFKKVILISANELRRLHAIFGECFRTEYRVNEPDNIRLAVGWKEFIGKLTGSFSAEQKQDFQEFNNKTIAELTKIAFGIPGVSKFADMRIKDILTLNPARIQDRETINELKNYIREKYEKLDQEILNKGDRYKYSFYIDDVLYYWISQDDLP